MNFQLPADCKCLDRRSTLCRVKPRYQVRAVSDSSRGRLASFLRRNELEGVFDLQVGLVRQDSFHRNCNILDLSYLQSSFS